MKFYIDMVFSLCSVSFGNMTMPCTYVCAYTHTPFFGNKSKGKHPTHSTQWLTRGVHTSKVAAFHRPAGGDRFSTCG